MKVIKGSRKSLKSRRKAMQGILSGAVGAGLLKTEWSAPVVKSVIIPAHAVATAGGGDPVDGEVMSYWGFELNSAVGTDGINPPNVTVCATVQNNVATIIMQGDQNKGRRRAVVPTDMSSVTAVIEDTSPDCESEIFVSGEFSVLAISAASITIAFRSGQANEGYNITVPAGECGFFRALDGLCKKKPKKKKNSQAV